MPLPAFLGKLIGAPVVEKIFDNVIPDRNARKEAQEAFESALLEASVAGANAQATINAAEAQHGSVFVAGWRPFIGWICGASLGLTYFVFPLVTFGMKVAGRPEMEMPVVLDDNLWVLLTGMLGLGGLRTYEKLKGVARNQ